MSGGFLAVHFGLGASAGLPVVFLGDLAGDCGGLTLADPGLGQLGGDAILDDPAGGAELLPDGLGLANQGFQDDVRFSLLVAEIAAMDALGWLQLAVDAAIALFEPRRIPGQVEVDEVGAAGLQIDAFARRVGADQNPQGLHRGVGVEGALHRLAAIRIGRNGEDADPLVLAIRF